MSYFPWNNGLRQKRTKYHLPKTQTDRTKHPYPNPSNISLIPTLRRKKDNKRSLRVLHWKNGVLHSGPLGKFLKDLLSC